MKDITIIVPVNKIDDKIIGFLKTALNSIEVNRKNYDDELKTLVICTSSVDKTILDKALTEYDFDTIVNYSDKTDFCSQINIAVKSISTDYFSILEYDDVYTPKWFKMAKEYFYTNEDVSVFLPINVQYEASNPNLRQYCNEIVWANEFSKELGYIDFDCLENFYGFNLTGGIFNRQDFVKIGSFKPSIEVAFNYEFLLRLTNKKLKVFVVPKEGYCHILNREGSLSDKYMKTLTDDIIKKWFNIAKCEYPYVEERKVTLTNEEEQLK